MSTGGRFVAFATAPGSVASDGAGANGLFTAHLLNVMPNGEIYPCPDMMYAPAMKGLSSGMLAKTTSLAQPKPWRSAGRMGRWWDTGGR